MITITAAFTHFAFLPLSIEHRGPENKERIIDINGKFCTNAITAPPS
jgi:hypothetical protein